MSDRVARAGRDLVRVRDQLQFGFVDHSSGPTKRVIISEESKPLVQIEGFFTAVCRERGKLVYGTRREWKKRFSEEWVEHAMKYLGSSDKGSGS